MASPAEEPGHVPPGPKVREEERGPDGSTARGASGSDREELADLLRSRRERLKPEDVGLPGGSRRRTPGLRREEVALLASVSTTYYTFLEQGREVRPSRQVLRSLAGALRLGAAERAHLDRLAHGAPSAEPEPEALAPGVKALVERLDPNPTYVTGRLMDVLAWNRSARTVFADWPVLPREERNLLWWMFADPRDWEKEAASMLARFRAAASRRGGDPEFDELVDRLHRASPEVREWWPRHEVVSPIGGTKRVRHPALGEFTLRYVVLNVAEHPDQKLVTYSAAEGEPETLLADLAASIRP